jgi:hypothetical protein
MMRGLDRQGADMAENSPDENSAAGAHRGNVVHLRPPGKGKAGEIVSFNRRELDQILRVYGFKVADGEWRDYAIDMLKDRAVFSVFRRTAEVPLYRIEKDPKNTRRQGAYSVVGTGGHILKRGHELANVLRVFDKKPRLVSV